ncbi:borealin-like [Strongylocentrotus purpuratus]|uniref:Borealin n=1 Tax=Strongylocentrotus purpuratus TaxID=7668 RepID=A0A7M7N4J5_STRPU|nr:borealin-like [Strongylocentrotus purpuratus]XP_030831154.1 borealin-like [Strongylocentrotus purpuratus]
MPRRRKTRLATRAKPLLPEATDELDMEKETREQKLETYLKDFDIQVEQRIREMNTLCTSLCRSIKSSANLFLMKMPKETKNMKAMDFFAQDSVTPSVKVIQQISKTVDEMITLPKTVTDAISESESEETAASSTASSTAESDTENSEMDAMPKKSTRSTRKAPGTRKKATASTAKRTSARKRTRAALQETPINSNNTGSVLQTPANAMSFSSINTPFITPKFDPSSKMTPATVRRAKKGELLVSLSGSPVEARNSPKDPTQSMEKLKENIETLFTQEDVDRQNILILQETLSKLLKQSS